jgi:DNA-binding NarL/FixJ family response regulator
MELHGSEQMDFDGFRAHPNSRSITVAPHGRTAPNRNTCGTTRVLLAHSYRMVREALRALLEQQGGSAIAVVAEAADGAAVLERAANTLPDIVVMDIGLPDLDGIEITKRLLKLYPSVKVIALSVYADRHFVTGMLEAGASGYIVTTATGEDLLRAIEQAVNGRTYVCSAVASALIDAVKNRGNDRSVLGRRETEVLKLLAQGLRTPEIGERLHISASTVEVHRRNIMAKLDLHSAIELTKYAIREGLIAL